MRRNNRRAEQRLIGTLVIEARAAGVPWKVLVERFGRHRMVLYRYARIVSL